MSSKVVHYSHKDWHRGWWKVTACWHTGPEKHTDDWKKVTCKKCLKKKGEEQ